MSARMLRELTGLVWAATVMIDTVPAIGMFAPAAILSVSVAAAAIGMPLVVLMPLVGAIFWVAATPAEAKEAKPFNIVKFSMQTTGPTQESVDSHGVRHFVNPPENFTAAGGHPWALTTDIEFANEELIPPGGGPVVPSGDPKDVVIDLPQGLLGDPQAVPRCSLTLALSGSGECPAATQVGEVVVRFYGGEKGAIAPIVNLVPERGESAEFGLEIAGLTTVLTGHVIRTATGYGLAVVTNEIPIADLVSIEATFWGVPADPVHNPERGLNCGNIIVTSQVCKGGDLESNQPLVPFLTMPTNCAAGAQIATARADSWESPGRINLNNQYEGYVSAETTFAGVTGCDTMQFNPSIELHPDTLLADEPVGLGIDLEVPQVESTEASATPELRNATVTLPEGLSISPGIVDGIQACQESGPEGIDFTGPGSEEVGANGELELAAGHCPDASTVGTAEAETPLLGSPVYGHVYLARPGCGGAGERTCTEQDALDGNLYKLYLELGGTGELAYAGVHIKVEGKTEPNPATGQLTTVFEDNPELPFSKLKIDLNEGARAPLAMPFACGPATTNADLTPWSAPGQADGVFVAGTPDATPSSYFNVEGCQDPPVLKPGFLAGTVTPQAGQFSAFTLTFTRKDREQYFSRVQVRTPQGLLGTLANVPLCGEPSAAQGTCSTASRIGSTTVASGAGSHPFEIGGEVFLTGGYKGAPFGLSIVTHVVAGPFNLGLVVVRARIDVDPESSTLTVTSDPLPQIVFGVPLRLQRVTVDIDRPGFMFNPTNCGAKQISATLSGAQGAKAEVSSPFAVGGCKSLAFKPQFKVSTSGHTSRRNGASLDAKLAFPKAAFGSEANVTRVKVSLPKRLPSRLSTLQKACLAATFQADPAACPPGSIVGIARTSTPVLPVGLEGPVYFVSHGGEAFPSLVVVLQGDGVRVDLTGTTFISKAGITSSTFKTVPDVPVDSFELYLPEGRGSALAANGNLCKSPAKRKVTRRVHGRLVQRTTTVQVDKPASLAMPTEFIAQNGAVLRQSTKIEVTGCTSGGKASSVRRADAAHSSTTGGSGK